MRSLFPFRPRQLFRDASAFSEHLSLGYQQKPTIYAPRPMTFVRKWNILISLMQQNPTVMP
jgi:hypothetical protein